MTTIKGNFGGPNNPQQEMDMSKTTEIKCEVCMNDTFKQTLLIRKMSALLSPTSQETIIPAAVFACEKCGHVNSDFRQSELEL